MQMGVSFGSNTRGFFAPPGIETGTVLEAYRDVVERRLLEAEDTVFSAGDTGAQDPTFELEAYLIGAERRQESWEWLTARVELSLDVLGVFCDFKLGPMPELDFVRLYAVQDSLGLGGTYYDFETRTRLHEANLEVAQAVSGILLPDAPILCVVGGEPLPINDDLPVISSTQRWMDKCQTTFYAGNLVEFRKAFIAARSDAQEDSGAQIASMSRAWLDCVGALTSLAAELAQDQSTEISLLPNLANPMSLEEVEAARDRFLFQSW